MKIANLLAASFVSVLAVTATAATAATLTNLDDQEYTIYVIENGEEQEVAIGAQGAIEGICASVCNVGMTKEDELVEFAEADEVLIEGGQLFLMEKETGTEPSEPAAEQNQ